MMGQRYDFKKTGMILMEDLTKTRELSDEIAYLKEHYEGVIDSIPSYLLTFNRRLELVSANKTFCEAHGKKETEMVGKPLSEIFPLERVQHASFEEGLRKAVTTGEPQVMKELEYDMPRQGTKIINARILSMDRNHDPGDRGDAEILLIMDDITEKVRIGESLRQVRELSTRVIEGIPVGIEVLDQDMIVRGWNEGMQRIFGHRAEEAVGKSIVDLFPQLMKEIGGEAFQKVLTAGEVVALDNIRYESEKKGMKFLNIRYAPLEEKGRISGIVGIIEDVTAKKELELEVCRQERLSVIGQLAAGVAHELNNPLSIICGNIEVFMKNLEKAEVHKEELEAIRRELERCRGLAQNLLNLSRQSEPVIQRVDVNGLIKEILYLMRSEIQFKKIAVETNLSSHLLSILADKSQLEQVFMNLILNASQAMPNGGRLRLTTQNAHHGRTIRIRLEDSGVGIPREDLHKLFAPFYTFRGEKNGAGLGLTITKQIVENHKGWIQVRSHAGEGTTFFIELPAISEEGDVPKDRSPG